jgi:hypothetical protein
LAAAAAAAAVAAAAAAAAPDGFSDSYRIISTSEMMQLMSELSVRVRVFLWKNVSSQSLSAP